MPQRDLMAEAEAANAQQGSKRPGAILTPTAKPKIARTSGDSGMSLQDMSLQDLVTELDLVEMGEFDGVLTLKASDTLCDEALGNCDTDDGKEALVALQLVQGQYHSTGYLCHGKDIYKSLEAKTADKADAGTHYYIFHTADEGWYVSNTIFESRAQVKKLERDRSMTIRILAWADSEAANAVVPRQLHWPWWEKEPCAGISVLTLWELCGQLGEACSQLGEANKTLTEENSELLDQFGSGSGSSGGSMRPAQPDHAPPASAHGDAKGQGKNKGHGHGHQLKSRGGWMPKTASLIVAVRTSWDYAKLVADRFTNESWALHDLVEHKLWAHNR